ncbi:MAG TPA: hypothetical protein EYG03_06735 [Planctomycetes bacterium]|nr:hypothetical protein [Fuerstiella sp.]HIK91663.1 hypothetical protein [Planctomycetota bacterium]
MLIIRAAISTVLLAVGGTAAADDAVVFSGPQPGEKVPPLKVVMAYTETEDEAITDFSPAACDKPTLLVFVNGANRPAARLTRVLMHYSQMRANDGLVAGVVWLNDDHHEATEYLRQSISWWGTGLPLGVSVDGSEGPGRYGLNRNVNVTVLVADRNRVIANFALIQPSETDASMILAEVVKLVGGDVPTKSETILLSMPTRKLSDAKWHTAPQDIHFRRLLCRLLSAENRKAAEASAQAIEDYVHGDAIRTNSLTQVAESLGKGRTRVGSIPAARYLKLWRTKSTEDQ